MAGHGDLGFRSIGRRLTVFICTIIALGFAVIVFFYAQQQERNILWQNERAIHQVLDSVIEGLQTVMITGSADVAELYAEKVKGVKDVEDFRVVRIDGLEAFKDNETINRVNLYRKDNDFEPRSTETKILTFAASDPNLKQVLASQKFLFYYDNDTGVERLTFLLPILNTKKCQRCHGKEAPVLGVIKFSSSLNSVRESVRQTWLQSAGVLVVALLVVLVVTMLLLRRFILRPIAVVSQAMEEVARGDLAQQIPVLGNDELSVMATSFNVMTRELRTIYEGFALEHNKLQTILMGTHEGIVVTDGEGAILLVNPSAERLVGKAMGQIIDGGVLGLFEDPSRMQELLDRVDAGKEAPEMLLYGKRCLVVYGSTLRRADGAKQGNSIVIRDITMEKQLEQKLRDLSNIDPLTGLFNRRALDETLQAEFDLAAQQGRDLSILMFDIDHFKKFNDIYGHDQGDRVLKVFAKTVADCVRDVLDTVCRYGGEEFMVIARETSQSGAVILAERIRAVVEQMDVDGLRVTTSIGVAGQRETYASSPGVFIERADTALYAAKEGGRNRVCAAPAGEGK